MSVPTRVFVTDGNERSALAIVRALGRRGMSVIVGDSERVSLASKSRYCAHHINYPSPHSDRPGFERFLLDFVARGGIDVVLPVTDVTTHAVCTHQDAIREHAATAVPPLAAFDSVSDKAALLARAAQCGVPVPRTDVIENAGALPDVLPHLEYPVVVKPARSHVQVEAGWSSATVQYADSADELTQLYQRVPYLRSFPSLLQQRIVGRGVGAFMLFDRGRLISEFGHVRLREKPPSGGVSVLRTSTVVDSTLKDYAMRIFGPLGWHGVAMMEFKEDSRTGTRFLMEINGRFWGSLQLAIDAGVDFPFLVCELAMGRTPRTMPVYRAGVKSRWLLGDVDHLCLRLFKSDRALDLPPSAPSRFRSVIDFMKFHQRDMYYEIARLDDPRPFVYELSQFVRGLRTSWLPFHNNSESNGHGGNRHSSTSAGSGNGSAPALTAGSLGNSTGTSGALDASKNYWPGYPVHCGETAECSKSAAARSVS
jgi:predicted ATP-grasp superfamily ATP-dependent carboligase